MHQFEIVRLLKLDLFGFDASFTNSSLFMVLGVGIAIAFLMFAIRNRSLVPGRMQSVAEMAYEGVASMVRDNVGSEGMKYFPFVFSIFVFVLMSNMLGMIPYSFTVTSHIIVTLALALLVFVLVTAIGFMRHGFGYMRLFVPAGVPVWLLPLIVPIEIVSYLIRPMSLSVRLFANMMAGHTMMKVFAGFIFGLGVFGFAPLLATVAFTGLELMIAFLQAFVFTILTCIYLSDAINMHDHH